MIKNIIFTIRNIFKYRNITKKRKTDYWAAELIRDTHSIEKGLSINKPRMEFGRAKIEKIKYLIKKLKNKEYYQENIAMATAALYAYVKFHEEKEVDSEFISDLKKYLSQFEINPSYGGTEKIKKKELEVNISEIEKLFNSRHSIRDFDTTKKINEDDLKKALELAKRAPTACNRQAVRIHVLEAKKYSEFIDWIKTAGEFSNKIDKLILINAKVSNYNKHETEQYIVSASIYAAYLTLTLHTYGIGSCLIQRPVIYSKKWNQLRKSINIEEDEQIICCLGIGNIKDSFNVPISHRFESNKIIQFHK